MRLLYTIFINVCLSAAAVAASAAPAAPAAAPAAGPAVAPVVVSATPATNTPLKGDPEHGKALYQACSACHSIDDNDLGPRHRGVVDRKAGSVPDYNYSPALKSSGLTWTETNLDRWLTNPSVLVPGTKMFFRMDDPQSRADLIAYLKQLR